MTPKGRIDSGDPRGQIRSEPSPASPWETILWDHPPEFTCILAEHNEVSLPGSSPGWKEGELFLQAGTATQAVTEPSLVATWPGEREQIRQNKGFQHLLRKGQGTAVLWVTPLWILTRVCHRKWRIFRVICHWIDLLTSKNYYGWN